MLFHGASEDVPELEIFAPRAFRFGHEYQQLYSTRKKKETKKMDEMEINPPNEPI